MLISHLMPLMSSNKIFDKKCKKALFLTFEMHASFSLIRNESYALGTQKNLLNWHPKHTFSPLYLGNP